MLSSESINHQYKVISVEKIKAPEGMAGTNWHRYTIQKGNSIIDCKKTGTLNEVSKHAENVAEQINSRTSKGGSTYAAKKKTTKENKPAVK